MYCLVGNDLEITWEAKIGNPMGLRCDRPTNPDMYTLSYFVQRVKEELRIIWSLQYHLKMGLAATVSDYMQIPHHD